MIALVLEDKVTAADVNPGFLAFTAFFALAIILWLLMRNMNARMRRMSYRQQAAGRSKGDPQATDADAAEGLSGQVGQEPKG